MLKRLSSMTSMKRISSAFTDAEEQIDDGIAPVTSNFLRALTLVLLLGFTPYNVKEHDIQEITVPSCEKKNNVLMFSIEVRSSLS